MSVVESESYKIGLSLTAGKNFTLASDGAGGLKLARGSPGATTQDILTVDANGYVEFVRSPWVISNPTPIPGAGAFGSATASLRIRKEGKTVFYVACVDIANIGTASTTVALALPYAAVSTTIGAALQEFNGCGRESRTVGYVCTSFVKQGTSTLQIQVAPGQSIATNNVLNVSGFYESAA